MNAREFSPNFAGVAGASLPNFLLNTFPETLPGNGDIDIRLILDHSLLEMYALGGEIVLTAQIFPEGPLKSVKTVGVFDLQAHILSLMK